MSANDETNEVAQLREQVARQADLLRKKVSEFRFPPISGQQILDSGINVFSLHLFAESLGRILPSISDNEVFFEFEHRGVRLNIKAQKVE